MEFEVSPRVYLQTNEVDCILFLLTFFDAVEPSPKDLVYFGLNLVFLKSSLRAFFQFFYDFRILIGE